MVWIIFQTGKFPDSRKEKTVITILFGVVVWLVFGLLISTVLFNGLKVKPVMRNEQYGSFFTVNYYLMQSIFAPFSLVLLALFMVFNGIKQLRPGPNWDQA